jgi:hypothetical protein
MVRSSENDPIDKQLFWMNMIGTSIVVLLLGVFGWLYGNDLLNFMALLMGQPSWPGH